MTAADRKAIADALFTIDSLTADILDRLDAAARAKVERRAKRVTNLPRPPIKAKAETISKDTETK